jgi:hypothetical protein
MPTHELHLEKTAREKSAEIPKMGIVRRMIPVPEWTSRKLLIRKPVTDD